MATRKVKHARAMEKRAKFFETVHQGNQDWLKTAQAQRNEERKKADEAAKQKKIQKSKQLAKAHQARPQAPGGTAINGQYAEERRREQEVS